MKKKKIVFNKYVVMLAIIALLLSMLVPITYAFFTAGVQGNNTANPNIVQAGTMTLRLTDGNVVGTTSEWIPGSSITKSFTVENTGTLPASYSITLESVTNTFADKSDLVYEIVGTSSGTSSAYSTSSAVQAPGRDAKIIDNIAIQSGDIHSYTLTLTFLNKNENQNDNMGKSFTGKIQLYDRNNEPEFQTSAASKLLAVKSAGATDLEYDGTATLGTRGTTDNNLRYIGASPKNYVYFNCSTTNPSQMNDSTCEKWRIIGSFNNVISVDGNNNETSETLVKIIRNDSIGNYVWDTNPSSVFGGDGINQWGPSELQDGTPYVGSKLMLELNNDYLGNVTIGTDGKWYDGSYNKKTTNMPSTSINSTTLNMIANVKWYLGNPSIDADDNNNYIDWNDLYVDAAYKNERNAPSGNACINYSCSQYVVRTPDWVGKVALIYPSDYGYATGGGNTLSRSQCLNISFHIVNDSNADCYSNNWLSTENLQWNLSYYGEIDSSYYAHTSRYSSDNDDEAVYYPDEVRPTLFLKSNVSIIGGTGESNNPYKLAIN